MFVVGLTGGIGSGKTTVADRFATHGVSVVDADRIAHLITAPGGAAMQPIAERFGTQYIAPDGSLDRAAMRERVFGDNAAKTDLEAITHPLIREATAAALHAAHSPYAMLVAPLLVESGHWRGRVNRLLVVDCPVATQIRRVMQRNGFSRAQVEAIIAQQVTRETRLAAADDIILNDARELADLGAEVDALHRCYLGLAAA